MELGVLPANAAKPVEGGAANAAKPPVDWLGLAKAANPDVGVDVVGAVVGSIGVKPEDCPNLNVLSVVGLLVDCVVLPVDVPNLNPSVFELPLPAGGLNKLSVTLEGRLGVTNGLETGDSSIPSFLTGGNWNKDGIAVFVVSVLVVLVVFGANDKPPNEGNSAFGSDGRLNSGFVAVFSSFTNGSLVVGFSVLVTAGNLSSNFGSAFGDCSNLAVLNTCGGVAFSTLTPLVPVVFTVL